MYSEINKEIAACIQKICENYNEYRRPTTVIVPNHKDYKQKLELQLIKSGIKFSKCYDSKNSNNTLHQALIGILKFIQSPFTITTISLLASSPYCKQIKQDTNTPEINISPLLVREVFQKHTPLPYNNNINKNLDWCIKKERELLQSKKNHIKLENIIEQKKAITILKSFHEKLQHISCLENWYTDLQEFISLCIQNTKNNQFEKNKNFIIMSAVDFIGTQLNILKSLDQNTLTFSFILNSLLEKLENNFYQPTFIEHNVHIHTIESALYSQSSLVFILGLSHLLHTPQKNTNSFSPLIDNHDLNLSNIDTHHYHDYHINTLVQKENTILCSVSKTINDETHIPTQLAYIFNITTPPLQTSVIKNFTLPTIKKLEYKKSSSHVLTEVSATMIDTYHKCPYKFWLSHVLNLSSIEPTTHDIPAKTWGICIHHILNLFNKWLAKNPSISKDILQNEFKNIATSTIEKTLKHTLFSEIKQEKLLGSKGIAGIMQKVIELYTSSELLQKIDASEKKYKFKLNSIEFTGTIDTIFKTNYGPIIIDYKTGKTIPSSKDLETLRALQLPIYIYALEQHIPYKVQGAIHFQIHNENLTELNISACTSDLKSSYLKSSRKRPYILPEHFSNKIKDKLTKLTNHIKSQQFSSTPYPEFEETAKKRPNYCKACSYKLSCRYQNRMS
tara:strand:- start:44 stop:2068 length:2025 start_codon:yes stop_codon:yes gene_type:complete